VDRGVAVLLTAGAGGFIALQAPIDSNGMLGVARHPFTAARAVGVLLLGMATTSWCASPKFLT
jgi:uncharacterized membrane protein YdcZ (DUF606 family)